MLKLICFLLFILYNYVVFKYSTSLFLKSITKINIKYILIPISIVFIGVLMYFEIFIPEGMLMMIYFFILYTELKLVYNDKALKNIFGVLCFSINFFAIRLICISCYSIIFDLALYEVMSNYTVLTNISTIVFIITILYITLFKLFLPLEHMNMIITDKNNLKFSINILLSIYIFLIINTYSLYVRDNFWEINILNIKISICAIIGFFTALIYSYLFSKLQLYVVKVENIEREIQQDQLELKQLEDEATYDYFTSCFKREIVYEKIDNLLKDMPFFCIVFVDIDGLKITNDVYGHEEGDFYIKAVAEILNSEFVGKVIGRIGGDEFLVVLEHTDVYATMKCVVRCSERANNISKIFNKPYQTSISYGVVEVTPDNKLSRDELIKLADTYMYNFKKYRKKNRK